MKTSIHHVSTVATFALVASAAYNSCRYPHQSMKELLSKKEALFALGILLIFTILHVFGLSQPYHQDEYKWVLYSHPEIMPPGTVPHPPLTEIIYADTLGPLVGDDHFRVIPFAFGILDLFLIYCLARMIFGRKAALWSALLFTVCFYSLLATLMVDVDGAVMPAFFLAAAIGYFKLRQDGFVLSNGRWKWLFLLVVGAVGGFMVKVSGALPLAALALDFAAEKRVFADKRKLGRYALFVAGGIAGLALLLVVATLIVPFFDLSKAIAYWAHFADSSSFLGRGWFQTFIQFAKAVMYLSPFLICAPLFLIDRQSQGTWSRARAFVYFIIIGLVFYLFVFDFSLGALDRYLEFLVAPLVLLSGAALSRLPLRSYAKPVIWALIASLVIFFTQFIPQAVPALYPKTEWLGRMISLKWNFLFPFTGGSGPTGFYISFAFIVLFWIASTIVTIVMIRKSRRGSRAASESLLVVLLVFGLVYNLVFVEEYLFGRLNGSAPTLVHQASAFIAAHPEIKDVIVYNDAGGWEMRALGIYDRRLYAAPQFEDEYRGLLSTWKGHILFVEIPRVQKGSFYDTYLKSCTTEFERTDSYITAKVLDCTNRK